MRKIFITLGFIGFLNNAPAQKVEDHRLLIILDASENMRQPWNTKKTLYQAASDFINHLADSIYATNPNVKISMRVYGHLSLANFNNCKDSHNEIIFGKNNSTQISLRLADIKPRGKAALSYAITEAARLDMQPGIEPIHCNSVLIITGSEESCDDNYCALSKQYLDKKITGKQYIVTLKDDTKMQTSYTCLGMYLPVTNAKNSKEAIATIAAFYETDKFVIPDNEVETIQKPIAEQEDDATINSYNTFRNGTVVDTTKKTFVLFTSSLGATDIQLLIQDDRDYKPYTSGFTLPMKEKRSVTSARYRITYTINRGGTKEKRIKEFYARMKKDNVVDLD
jgi:hypothetical protein